MKHRNWPFSLALVALGVAAALPVLVMSAWLLYKNARGERERLIAKVDDLVNDTSTRVASEVRQVMQLAETLSRNAALIRGDVATFAEEARRHAEAAGPGVVIGVHELSGQLLVNTAVPPGQALPITRNRHNSAAVLSTGRPRMSGLVTGTASGILLVYATALVGGDPQRGWLINVAIPVNRIRDVLGDFTPAPGGAIGIVDRDGIFIARSLRNDDFVGQPGTPALITRMKEAEVGNWIGPGFEGQKIFVSYRREPISGWGIAASVSVEAMEAPIRAWLWQVGALSLIMIIISVGFATTIGRRLTRDMTRMRQAAVRVGSGEVKPMAFRVTEFDAIAKGLKTADETIAAQIERNRILAHELQHRVKNTLAVVNGIVTMTARGATDIASYRDSITGRLQALARVHTNLLAGARQGVTMRDLVASECAAFGPDRFEIEGADVWLTSELAADLALVLHELATNATKYGSLSLPSGRIAISWQRDTDAFTLLWVERGGPPVAPPQRKGFGSQLIEAVLVRKHGATLTLTHDPGGLTCSIILPANKLMVLEPDKAASGNASITMAGSPTARTRPIMPNVHQSL